ncbi:S8 family serine peptidase [Streptomyces litchfieldiae]|uniref:S8 family serine peptidase n=1 Tax=Streptomyces litchfieldiae TaxID=3075543 RepID=A0ABU2MU52_9ACTN|nr:S8 family serine peptidase [Streptomyces sp. DSM 44938]MDT0345172.1 S8 family serine peptidase [Streptomyces sp. DSM 44938]
MRHKRGTALAAAMSTGLILLAVGAPPAAADSAGAPREAPAATAPGAVSVRLVTGDTVTLTDAGAGRRVASVTPGPGREHIHFQQFEGDGRLTVLPSDAREPVRDGTVDPELFDVTALIEQRYDEAHTDTLPLLLARPEGVAPAAVAALTALHDDSEPSYDLPSVDATSLRVPADDLGAFWERLVPPAERAAAPTPRLRLDGRVAASLDRSTGQINAPAAWAAGYDGSGVTVAVLDTGADAEHPDLAGRITGSRDFSDSAGTHDAVGHGTHVAATVAGGGAASDGARTGVAPAADLLVGKVLGDDGYGTESAVIAGMEWAAAEGADIVNMSLGSDAPSDGTDPLSQAVDELTATTDTLFVVAAGNSGENGPATVTSPGAADAALTVGAVDRDDALAPFSSRGPRPGDAAVKPDVTAPGVGIVAARAAGTTMGQPVDERYTAASGTSMATPHVAGAAALLAEAHPDWGAAQLKDALVSTAATVSGTAVTEQGGGRVDLAAAVTGGVTATGTVVLGPFTTGDGEQPPGEATLRYTNTTGEPRTLELSAELATTGGRPLAAGALALGARSVTVAPGATAEVPLTVTPERAQRGDYYGHVTARAADGAVAVHTTVSVVVNGPTHTLTPTVIGADGERLPGAWPLIWGPDGFIVPDSAGERPSAEVEEGSYVLTEMTEARGADNITEVRLALRPEVTVTGDTEVTLDLSRTTPVQIRTPRPAEQRTWMNFQYYRHYDGHDFTHSFSYPIGSARLMVTPTEPVTEGAFEFASRWQLVAPVLDAEVPGSRLTLDPYYLSAAPLFDSGDRLTVADAGEADAPDLTGVRGRLAVVRGEPGGGYGQLAERAAESGAAAVMLVADPGQGHWTRWRPNGNTYAVPVVRVSHDHGTALLARAAERRTTVAFSGTARSPYLYDVMQTSEGHIPERVVHTVTDRNTARVVTTYADPGHGGWGSAQRISWRPHQGIAMLDSPREVPVGTTRTEYISAGDTVWQHYVHHQLPFFYDVPVTGFAARGEQRAYRAEDSETERWTGTVVRPAIPRGSANTSVRTGDTFALRIPEFTDSGGHWARSLSGDRVTATLFRDGTEVATADETWTTLEPGPGAAAYRLDITTERASTAWDFATHTDTSWHFRSDTTAEETPLPLLQLDYDTGTDAHNTTDSGRRHTIGITVRHQDALPAPRGVTVSVAASYDDGETFTEATRIRPRGDNTFAATLERPRGTPADAFVTLRVTARDAAGNAVEQTVHRAYQHRG